MNVKTGSPLAGPDFAAIFERHGLAPLRRSAPHTLQVNVGKRCNQACHHCHVDAGPKRVEIMSRATAERIVEVIAKSAGVGTVDITGGAPELNPNFRYLTESARRLGRSVMVRCNLTVIFVPEAAGLIEFYRENRVALVCSLPCYTAGNTDAQRGKGVFAQSIQALRMLNEAGYASADSSLTLDLVYNPVGAFLPAAQAGLEARYRQELKRNFGIEFNRLFAIANMPINRFANQLSQWGRLREYMELLVNHFNPATVDGLMCRTLVSVGWDGRLYDCDFNQMVEIPLGAGGRRALTIWDVDDIAPLAGGRIATASHCLGCTAGAGSGCGGALSQGA
jgi:radical SAM/Cys-rich protein